MKTKLIVSLFYVVGLLLLSLGICFMIVANLGVGPWDAMYVALSEIVGFTVGSWVFIIGILLILVNGLLMKEKPDFLAIITIFLIGSFIDLWLLIVFVEFPSIGISIRIAMLISGILIIAIGIASYLQSRFARNPVDSLMLAIQLRTGKKIAFIKTVMEVTVLFLALFMGGPIGVGTIIVTFCIGPLIQLFYPRVTEIKNRICNEDTMKG